MKSVSARAHGARDVRARTATLAATLSLLGGLLLVPMAQAGASSPPVITALVASSSLVAPAGGPITLHATVANGGTCTMSVMPAVLGFPVTQDCIPIPGKPKKLSFPATLAPNPSGKTVSYKWQLSSSPQGSTAKVTKTIAVVQEAFTTSSHYKLFVSTGDASAISCASTTFCAVITGGSGGGAGGFFVQNGSTVKKVVTNVKTWVGLSCASSTMCMAIDNAGSYYIYNGTHMSGNNPLYEQGSTKLADLTAVSCPSVTFCMVVSSGASTYSGAPANLHASPTLPSRPTLTKTAVSCTSATSCVAADVNGDGFAFNGSSWRGPKTVSSPSDPIVSISCRESPTKHSVCVVVTSTGHVWTMSPPDGSTNQWPALRESPSKASLGRSVSCASSTFCMVSDDVSVYQVVNGSLGGRVLLAGGTDSSGISCSAHSITDMNCLSVGKQKEYVGHVTLMK